MSRPLALILAFSSMLVAAALVVASHRAAKAHDAPSGWSYPFYCCSGVDCRPVSSGPNGLVHERPDGFEIATTGERLSYPDTRIKDSPDGDYHWCSVAGKNDSRTICLFVPPRSF